MSKEVVIILQKMLEEQGVPRRAFARNIGISPTALERLLSGATKPPQAKVMASLSASIGRETVLSMFPTLPNAELRVAIGTHFGTVRKFCRDAMVQEGPMKKLLDERIATSAEVLRRTKYAIHAVEPHINVDVSCTPDPSVLLENDTNLECGNRRPRRRDKQINLDRVNKWGVCRRNGGQLRDIALMLCELHLAIRSGEITPSWPYKTSTLTFEETLAACRGRRQNSISK